jgi:hypothetical protein
MGEKSGTDGRIPSFGAEGNNDESEKRSLLLHKVY